MNFNRFSHPMTITYIHMACLLGISYKLNNPDLSKLIMIESNLRLSLQICLHLASVKDQSVNGNDNIVSEGTRGQGVVQIEFRSIRQNLETLSFSFFGIQLEKTE